MGKLELRVAMGLLVVGNELLPQRSNKNTLKERIFEQISCKALQKNKEKRTSNQCRRLAFCLCLGLICTEDGRY